MRRSKTSPLVTFFVLVLILAFLAYRASQSHIFRNSPEAPRAGVRLGPADIYPDPQRTPGAIDADITQDNIDETVCNPDWSTKSIRPPEHYTSHLKREQLQEYGDDDINSRDYEEDHLIPLEIGGNPTDPRNLWPEPYRTSIPDGGAHDKDRVENHLHEQVCSRRLTLAEAQREIAADWYRVYVSLPSQD